MKPAGADAKLTAMTDMQETPQSPPNADEAAAQEQVASVEAMLFASDTPLSPSKIAQAASLRGRSGVARAVKQLNERYDRMGSAFRIEAIAGGYQVRTRPEYHDVLARLFKAKNETRLSQAALETLAIVAYRQPILRADVEAIRGVASGEVLRGLMEKQLAKIVGRAEVIGRPMLYGTTRRFLELFGLNSIEDLPRVEELRQPLTAQASGGGEREDPAEPESSASSPEDDTAAQPAQEDGEDSRAEEATQEAPEAEGQPEADQTPEAERQSETDQTPESEDPGEAS